jgi:hypothetical protein
MTFSRNNTTTYLAIASISLAIVFFAGFLFVQKGVAQIPPDPMGTMRGFAWSDMPTGTNQITSGQPYGAYGSGVGWISMSSLDISPTPAVSWGVMVDTSNGSLSGYAYAPHLGSTYSPGMPTVSGGNGYINFSGVQVNLSTGEFSGDAQACAVYQSSGCSGLMIDDMFRGGWTGQIRMSGTAGNGTYGVRIANIDPNTGIAVLDGFAWGSTNLGWISFRGVTIQLDPNSSIFNPKISLYTKPSCIVPGQRAFIIAQGQDMDMNTCQFTSDPDVLDQSTFDFGMNYALIETNSIQSSDLDPDIVFYASCASNDVNDAGNPYEGEIRLSMCPAGTATVFLTQQCATTEPVTVNWSFANAVSCTTPIPTFTSQPIPNFPNVNNVPPVTQNGSGSFPGNVGEIYSFECTGADGVRRTTRLEVRTQGQCGPGPGGGLIRPGFQEI